VPAKEVRENIHIIRGQEAATIIHIIRLKDPILLQRDHIHLLPDLIRLPAGLILRRDQAAVREAAEVLRVEGDNLK
jgi:hypothetical protein